MIDLSFSGRFGLYTLAGESRRGQRWIAQHVHFENWQGTPGDGIVIEGTGYAQDITDAAHDAGLTVAVNGRRYVGNGRVAA